MMQAPHFNELLAWRALTGFFLAGIYPVGMKLASLWFPRGLGAALGWLLGALVLGSASPHALRALGAALPWQSVFIGVAFAAALAGLLVTVCLPEPAKRPGLAVLRLSALASVWRDSRVRASVLGYFGHMGELYTVRGRCCLQTPALMHDPGAATPEIVHPALQADRRAVWLTRGVLVCDGYTFGRALDAQDAALAARLYQGELLPGYFEEWVQEERRHLAARADTLARALTACLLPDAPVAAALPAVQPTTSPPTADTSPNTDAGLPLYLTRLVGFEASGSALAAAVSKQRLVVLRGPGGAGQTRLAVEVARTLAQRSGGPPAAAASMSDSLPFDLLAFVPLAACTTRAQMLDAVLLSLRQQGVADTADAAERVARTLAGRRVLLVLPGRAGGAGLADLGAGQRAQRLEHGFRRPAADGGQRGQAARVTRRTGGRHPASGRSWQRQCGAAGD